MSLDDVIKTEVKRRKPSKAGTEKLSTTPGLGASGPASRRRQRVMKLRMDRTTLTVKAKAKTKMSMKVSRLGLAWQARMKRRATERIAGAWRTGTKFAMGARASWSRKPRSSNADGWDDWRGPGPNPYDDWEDEVGTKRRTNGSVRQLEKRPRLAMDSWGSKGGSGTSGGYRPGSWGIGDWGVGSSSSSGGRARPVAGLRAPRTSNEVAAGVRSTNGCRIRVQNVPLNLEPRDIKEAFAETGRVRDCKVDRGVAWVTFDVPIDAKKAVQTFDRGELNGKTIFVTLE